jgi:hypothetical protein
LPSNRSHLTFTHKHLRYAHIDKCRERILVQIERLRGDWEEELFAQQAAKGDAKAKAGAEPSHFARSSSFSRAASTGFARTASSAQRYTLPYLCPICVLIYVPYRPYLCPICVLIYVPYASLSMSHMSHVEIKSAPTHIDFCFGLFSCGSVVATHEHAPFQPAQNQRNSRRRVWRGKRVG